MGPVALAPPTWAGVVVSAAALGALAIGLVRWGRRPGWDQRHRLAAAAAPLLVYAVLAFVVDPIGDVGPVRKFGHNGVLGVGVVVVLGLARRKVRVTRQVIASTPVEPDRPQGK